MSGRMKAIVPTLIALLVTIAGTALGQSLPSPEPVPDGIPSAERQTLEAQFGVLSKLQAKLEPLIADHERNCIDVDTQDSAVMTKCAENVAFLSEQIGSYFEAIAEYNARLASAQADSQIEPVELRLAQPGVVLNSWGGRVYRYTCAAEHDCAWVRVSDSSQFKPDDEVRIFPGGFVAITLPNGQVIRHDPEADGSREVIIDLGYVYDEDMYRWEDGDPPSPAGSIDPPAASQPASELPVPDLYVDPESIGLEAQSFTGQETKLYLPVEVYRDRGPDDRAGMCRCSLPLIEVE